MLKNFKKFCLEERMQLLSLLLFSLIAADYANCGCICGSTEIFCTKGSDSLDLLLPCDVDNLIWGSRFCNTAFGVRFLLGKISL